MENKQITFSTTTLRKNPEWECLEDLLQDQDAEIYSHAYENASLLCVVYKNTKNMYRVQFKMFLDDGSISAPYAEVDSRDEAFDLAIDFMYNVDKLMEDEK